VLHLLVYSFLLMQGEGAKGGKCTRSSGLTSSDSLTSIEFFSLHAPRIIMRASLLLVAIVAFLAIASASPLSADSLIDASNVDAAFLAGEMEQIAEDEMIDAGNIEAAFAQLNVAETPLNSTLLSKGGRYGIDASSYVSVATWECLRRAGFSSGVVRAYQSNCEIDPNGVHSLENARKAGFGVIDVYLFPSFPCKVSPEHQVDSVVDMMGGDQVGRVWFDIESSGSSWSRKKARNVAWLRAAMNHAVARLGADHVGIYSSASGWETAMGASTEFSSHKLWYGK
jgi:hypothetical protein